MAVYKTTICPHCRNAIKTNEPTGWNDIERYLGDPIDTCPFCKKQYRTKKQRWSQMSNFSKTMIYLRVGASLPFVAGYWTAIPILIFGVMYSLFDWQFMDDYDYLPILGGIYFICLVIASYLITIGTKEYIDKYR